MRDLSQFEIEWFEFLLLGCFIGILGESFEIQLFAIFYIDFDKGFKQFEIEFF